jgi:hypothetical protein
MSLLTKLKEDRIFFFKQRNETAKAKVAYQLLGVLISESTKKDKEPKDDFIVSTMKKFIENANVIINNAKDPIDKYEANLEIEILTEYLPKQLTDEEIIGIIVSLYENGNGSSLGEVMRYFKENYINQYDDTKLSSIVVEVLNERKGIVKNG